MEAEDGKTASVAAAAAGRNPEVWGYMLLRIAQAAGVVFISVQFQPALLTAAECISDEDGQLWNWLNFDSLIPGILMIAGITSALLTPAIGAACDYTTLRKPLLLGASFVQFGATVLGVVLAPNDTGVAISLLALFIFNVCYAMLLTGQSTWLPELTTSHDELARINRNGYTTLYIAEVVFVIVNVGVVQIAGLNYLWQGRFAALFCGASGLLCVALAWQKLEARKPSHELPEGTKSLVAFSFRRMVSLWKQVRKDYPDFFVFLMHVMVSDPAQAAVVSLGSIFLTSELNYKASVVSIVFGLAIVSAAAGSHVGNFLRKRVGIKRAIQALLFTTFILTSLGGAVLPKCTTVASESTSEGGGLEVSPPPPPLGDALCGDNEVVEGCDAEVGDLILPAIFGVLWGVLLGGAWSQQMLLFAQSAPGGLEAECAGLSTMSSTAFVWVPPLVMLIMNEATGSLRWGLVAMSILMGVGACVLQGVDIDRHQANIQRSLVSRQFGAHVRAVAGAAAGPTDAL